MRVRFLEDTTFRGKKYKKNSFGDLPDSVAHKLIAMGKAESE